MSAAPRHKLKYFLSAGLGQREAEVKHELLFNQTYQHNRYFLFFSFTGHDQNYNSAPLMIAVCIGVGRAQTRSLPLSTGCQKARELAVFTVVSQRRTGIESRKSQRNTESRERSGERRTRSTSARWQRVITQP